MKISVIIPVFNAEQTIEKCLKSIINQTYRNVEIIVINDGSTDNTKEKVLKIKNSDARINLIDQENAGIYQARRNGFEYSTGESVFFIDADDYLESEAIELLANKMNENFASMVIGNHFKHENGKRKRISNEIPDIQNKQSLLGFLLLGKIKGYIWARLIKRNLINYLNIPKKGVIFDDELINFQIFCDGTDLKIALLDKPIYNYVIHENNSIHSENPDYVKSIFNHLKIVEKMIFDTGLSKQLKKEIASFNCRGWVVYSRKGGENAKNKKYSDSFLSKYYPDAKKHIPLHQRIEIMAYKKSFKFGVLTTNLMLWIKRKLSI